MKMQTPDGVEMNLDRIAQLFPGCITETRDEKGAIKRAVDFDLLRQELSSDVVEGPVERYQLNWPGKRQAVAAANAPINKTLRPCEKESVNFDTTGNLYIEGDNLDALKLLQETYLGKVKMIYIDPPYNTGNDFVYNDSFSANKDEYDLLSGQKSEEGGRLVANTESNGRFHSDWLSMIYPRIKLARNLLSDDGLIFISIDDNEVHNLRKTCDEVFGAENFIAENVWKKSYGGGAKSKHIVVLHEYILMYAKNKELLDVLELPPDDKVLKYYKFSDDKIEKRGPYRKQPLATNSMDDRPNLKFSINWDGHEIWPEKQWQWSKVRVEEALEKDELVFTKKDGGWTIDYKQYLKNEDGVVRGAKLYSLQEGPYTQVGTGEIKDLFGNGKVFSFPKPSALIKHFVSLISTEDIIMDFFSGSAVTADAVIQLNALDGGSRKFIMVQLPEACDEKSEAFKAGYKNICEIGKERIRRAGTKILEELEAKRQAEAKEPDLLSAATPDPRHAPPDVGFRVLKVDSSNMKDVWYTPDQLKQHELELFTAHIKEDRTAEDLLFQIMLDWGSPTLDAKIRKEKVGGKTVFIVNDNDILACFEQGITEELVKQMAAFKPLRAVFRDDAFDDSLKINVEQIFKVLSPGTEVKSI
jgi:adenine-specific DNA-methyltransferase